MGDLVGCPCRHRLGSGSDAPDGHPVALSLHGQLPSDESSPFTVTGRAGVTPLRRGLPLGLIVTACLALGSCAQTTSAQDVFGGEALTYREFSGMAEVSEGWIDGERGGTATKPNYASVTRVLRLEQGTDLNEGFTELVEAAVGDGWVDSTPASSSELFFAGNKDFPEGPGNLVIGEVPGSQHQQLTVSISLNN